MLHDSRRALRPPGFSAKLGDDCRYERAVSRALAERITEINVITDPTASADSTFPFSAPEPACQAPVGRSHPVFVTSA